MIIWIATRLIYFPFWVISSILFNAPPLIQKSYRWENLFQRPIVPRIFFVMLCLLVCLHVFWTYVLLRIAYIAATGSEIGDTREESDDEEETIKKDEKKEK